MADTTTQPESVSQRVGDSLGAQLHESQTVNKHRRIARAATEIFIAKGYQTASVDEIALRAGVSKQTVYKHFGSKEELFLAVAAAATDAVTDKLAVRLEANRDESVWLALTALYLLREERVPIVSERRMAGRIEG